MSAGVGWYSAPDGNLFDEPAVRALVRHEGASGCEGVRGIPTLKTGNIPQTVVARLTIDRSASEG